MSVSAFVLITLHNTQTSQKTTDNFPNNLKKINGIDSVYEVEDKNSPYNIIAKITTGSLRSLYNIIQGNIKKLPGVKETTTMIILD